MNFMLMNSQGQKLQENQNTINNLMDRVRELQCEINYMHDSKGFMDVESVHSGHFSHVSSDSASFLLQDERGDLLGRAKIMPLITWNTQFTSGNVFPILRHPVKGYPHHGTIQMQEEFPRGPVQGDL